MNAALLSASALVGGYSAADMILKGVSLQVRPGEIVSIIGPNGAGKSTFLKAVAGIVRVREGAIEFAGQAIANLKPREIAQRGIAFVPQEQNIFPSMTVRENLEMGGFVEGRATLARIDGIFARFPILAEKRRRAARTLSGGQRQILAMAMALMVSPRLLLLDEPSAGLSPVAAETLFQTITTINQEGVAVLMVEQNALEALSISARAYVLVDGRNGRDGEAKALAADPEVRRLFLGATI
jgi:branched-chain amino acid transport system ATP-binding protein/neutral amino acid transport system ATP-binding protein